MKVLCASLSGPGHAHPMAAVARALASRGHDVTLLSGGAHAEDAARAGASFLELPVSRGSPRQALEPYEDAEDMARRLAPVVSELAPDVAVVDLITLGAALAAEMCEVPYATLSIHPLHTPSAELPPFGLGRAPGRGLMRLSDASLRRKAVWDLERARDALNGSRARLGLPREDRLDAQLSPSLVLVATLPALEVPRGDWPERAHVIGPCLWDAGGEAPPLPPGAEPLVLVAATTAHDQGAMLRATMGAVARLGARAVVTTGGATDRIVAPPKTTVVPFASHDAVLPACAAVVCSGGHGIVARALSQGVPLVVVPGHGDQRENGYRVARAGAGVRVMRARARPIERAIHRVLSNRRIRDAAARIKVEAALLDGPAAAAGLIETLAARGAYDTAP